MYFYACVLGARTANRVVCVRQLKWVRKQFNEYEKTRRTQIYMSVTLASYVVVALLLADDHPVLQRRINIFCERFAA